jgi:uncharacterized protein
LEDPVLKIISNELRSKHGCHTAILYGSRARGDATQTSDYDVIGFRKAGPAIRDARKLEGRYLDAFIYPESKVFTKFEELAHVRGGVILFEENNIGSQLLERLRGLNDNAPELLNEDEYQARYVWAQKMIDRARMGDAEGNFRRAWLLTALLEDYFLMTGQRYLGPKMSLRWLRDNQIILFNLFEKALRPSHDLADLEALVEFVQAELKVKGRFNSIS